MRCFAAKVVWDVGGVEKNRVGEETRGYGPRRWHKQRKRSRPSPGEVSLLRRRHWLRKFLRKIDFRDVSRRTRTESVRGRRKRLPREAQKTRARRHRTRQEQNDVGEKREKRASCTSVWMIGRGVRFLWDLCGKTIGRGRDGGDFVFLKVSKNESRM